MPNRAAHALSISRLALLVLQWAFSKYNGGFRQLCKLVRKLPSTKEFE